MLVRMLVSVAGPGFSYGAGETVEAEKSLAADLVSAGHAVVVEDAVRRPSEKATAPASTPKRRRK